MSRILEVCCILVLALCLCDWVPGLGIGGAQAVTCDNHCRVRQNFSMCVNDVNGNRRCFRTSLVTCSYCHKQGNAANLACNTAPEVAAGDCTEDTQTLMHHEYTCTETCSCDGVVFAEAPSVNFSDNPYFPRTRAKCNLLNPG